MRKTYKEYIPSACIYHINQDINILSQGDLMVGKTLEALIDTRLTNDSWTNVQNIGERFGYKAI